MFTLVFTFFTLYPSLGPALSAQEGRGLAIDKTPSEKRYALVIGNSAYEGAELRNPTNDAKDMALKLSTLGFDVIHTENVGMTEMKRVIRTFGDKIRNGGIGLFYFAGHGLQVKGLNYLVPAKP